MSCVRSAKARRDVELKLRFAEDARDSNPIITAPHFSIKEHRVRTRGILDYVRPQFFSHVARPTHT